MNGSAELQVTAETYCKVIEASLFTLYRKQIGKRLRRVIVSAVAGIDDRHACIECCYKRRSLFRVPHCDNIRVAANHFYGIRNALTFGA